MSANSFLIDIQDPRFPKLGPNFPSYEEWLKLHEHYRGTDRSYSMWKIAKKTSVDTFEKEEKCAFEYIDAFNEKKLRDASGETAEYEKIHLTAPIKALRDKGLSGEAIVRILQHELSEELANIYSEMPMSTYTKEPLFLEAHLQDEDRYISKVLDFEKLWATKAPIRDLDVALTANKNG
jgi:hypothetical protein